MDNALKIRFCAGMSRFGRGMIAVAVSLLMVSCATTTSTPPETPPAADTLDWYGEALHWSRTAAEHRAIFEQTFRLAAERLEALAEGREPGTWGISADADETLVDNSQYQLEIGRRGEEFAPESWGEWVDRRAAPALPGAVEFTRRVQELGGVVAVVTNRDDHQCAATADNLRQVGIAFDIVLCQSGTGQKEPRFDAVKAGTTGDWPGAQFGGDAAPGPAELVMWLGDNIGDFPDLEQDARGQDGALNEFGDRFFALPNPMYGSWANNPKE